MVERPLVQSLTRSWPLDRRGFFEQGIKLHAPLGLDFGLGLGGFPIWPLTVFYWLFSAHFFGLSTKFGNSIPRPLDLDGHSVKQPLSYT
jgi:hypothetical protein